MYTIESAAKVLGVSKRTVWEWIRKDGLKVKKMEGDGKRVYLAEEDLVALADKHQAVKARVDQERDYPDLTGLYSMQDVARILGVKTTTVKHWLKNKKVEKTLVTTDRKRVYVGYSGLVTMANQHNCLISYESGMPEQGSGATAEEKLYTLVETAQLLDVSEKTVRKWLLLYNIEGKKVESDKGHMYITHSDVLLLAGKNPREGRYPVSLATDIGEMKSRLEKIEAAIVRLEGYIKRSVYLGR